MIPTMLLRSLFICCKHQFDKTFFLMRMCGIFKLRNMKSNKFFLFLHQRLIKKENDIRFIDLVPLLPNTIPKKKWFWCCAACNIKDEIPNNPMRSVRVWMKRADSCCSARMCRASWASWKEHALPPA